MLRAAMPPVCLRLRSRALRDSLDSRPAAKNDRERARKNDKVVSATRWILDATRKTAMPPVCLRLRSRALRDSLDSRPAAKNDRERARKNDIECEQLPTFPKNKHFKFSLLLTTFSGIIIALRFSESLFACANKVITPVTVA
jgi:hypothetical protein